MIVFDDLVTTLKLRRFFYLPLKISSESFFCSVVKDLFMMSIYGYDITHIHRINSFTCEDLFIYSNSLLTWGPAHLSTSNHMNV